MYQSDPSIQNPELIPFLNYLKNKEVSFSLLREESRVTLPGQWLPLFHGSFVVSISSHLLVAVPSSGAIVSFLGSSESHIQEGHTCKVLSTWKEDA